MKLYFYEFHFWKHHILTFHKDLWNNRLFVVASFWFVYNDAGIKIPFSLHYDYSITCWLERMRWTGLAEFFILFYQWVAWCFFWHLWFCCFVLVWEIRKRNLWNGNGGLYICGVSARLHYQARSVFLTVGTGNTIYFYHRLDWQ